MSAKFRWLAGLALAMGALVASEARAASFGPLPVTSPSEIVNQDGSVNVVPTGSVRFTIDGPSGQPQQLSLTDVTIDAGNLHFLLDPTLATPALGVIQPDGRFLIPTLFLVGDDGQNQFDLAIPNVLGTTYGDLGSPSSAYGIFTQFQVDAGGDVFDVSIFAAVPEPGTVSLLLLGIGALALRRREEIAR